MPWCNHLQKVWLTDASTQHIIPSPVLDFSALMASLLFRNWPCHCLRAFALAVSSAWKVLPACSRWLALSPHSTLLKHHNCNKPFFKCYAKWYILTSVSQSLVLVCFHCSKKVPQILWFKPTQIHYFTVLHLSILTPLGSC